MEKKIPKYSTRVKNLKKQENEVNKPKKMTGILFYLVFMIVLMDDLIDLGTDSSVILSFLAPISTIFVAWILIMYFLFEKVSLKGKKLRQKVALWSAALIIETIPFVSSLPMGVTTLCVTRLLENNETIKKIAGKKLK